MMIHAGERVEPAYLKEIISVFEREPSTGWVTSWAFSTDPQQNRPYAGFDFSLPLELLYHHPVPFAVISYAAFRSVGGWNLNLPAGWRMWDLWLALQQSGFQGIVIPKWLAHFDPKAGRTLDVPQHGKAHEVILEAVAERNSALFAEHAVSMYVNLASNPRYSSPSVNAYDFQPPAPNGNSSANNNGHGRVFRLRRKVVRKTIDLLSRWR
jgi:hypothetical protein